jgi:serine protease Do
LKENFEKENNEDFVYSKRGFTDNKTKKNKISFISSNKNKLLLRIIWVLVALIMAFSGIFFWLWHNGDLKLPVFRTEEKNSNAPEINIAPPPEEGELTAEQIYEKVCKSVVGVAMYDYNADIFSEVVGQGSGIIISKDGYIITNAHVVGSSLQKKVTVIFKSNISEGSNENPKDTEEIAARVVGVDKKTDLAVIKIDKNDLQPAVFGDSSKIKPGATCYALGNPGGLDFYSSMTRGMVSAVNRSINKSEVKYIQTDAAINPGNSGGPLLNKFGQVIGMNSGKIQAIEFEGMGFAIPANTIQKIIKELIENGFVSGRVWIGITVKEVGGFAARVYNVHVGLLIVKIDSNSRIKNVNVGDILTKIEGKKITSVEDLSSEIKKHKPGDKVRLEVTRISRIGGETKNFETTAELLEDKGTMNYSAS